MDVKKKTKVIEEERIKPYLPDDIIPNILCRLPANNVRQCRFVCRSWRDLTSTHDFVGLHFRHNSLPMIAVANPNVKHFMLDKWWEPERTKLTIYRFPCDYQNFYPDYQLLFSHSGLIVFTEKFFLQIIVILNPISHEKVTISISKDVGFSKIYGVFFNPSLRQYCSLWRTWICTPRWGCELDDHPRILYMVLDLGTNPAVRMITYPFPSRYKKSDSPPLLIDNYLYWMLEAEEKRDNQYTGGTGRSDDIMQFDIVGETFSVKHCPVPVDTECDPNQTHILNIDGALSFLVIFPSKITIWRLQDHVGQLWTANNYTFNTANFRNFPKPIAVVNGNLALLCDRRLLVCDLLQGTIKSFRKTKYPSGVLLMSHQVSLASLRNCDSTLCLDTNGEVHVRLNSSY